MPDAEQKRLNACRNKQASWKQWGPYLAERAWGTVREDYSRDGSAWSYFPHDQARSRAYRWNEDGLAGFCDDHQYLCFGLALWNGKDPFLKERLFGLAGPEGNHGEDVKELYWYEDCTPTHSYASMRYHYPQAEYPYEQLRTENASRGYTDREYEISDTGVFKNQQFFDVQVIYAKHSEDDLLISVNITNRAKHSAQISCIPQLWYRNTWAWGYENGPLGDVMRKPRISRVDHDFCGSQWLASHPALGDYHFYWQGKPELMATDNESNTKKLFGSRNQHSFVKDAFHEYVVNGQSHAINPQLQGTKAGLHYQIQLQANETRTLQFRLCESPKKRPFAGFKPIVTRRHKEAQIFFNTIQSTELSADLKTIQRQALAGMLWSKQLYYYDVQQWTHGDPGSQFVRKNDRNRQWQHLHNFDIMSMPDKWEYPWYALWDTAFHMLPMAMVDTEFAKQQLSLTTSDCYMHPNGQLPAYEWAYGDVNPPVHAWATWYVYQLSKQQRGKPDTCFLESVFHKLLLNFSWWVNQKDDNSDGIFQGGFLGLDNISLFDRSKKPPAGGLLNQSDGTAWMGFFAQNMLTISIELATANSTYENLASKFFEHYLLIANAINGKTTKSSGLWNDEDGFYYDHLELSRNRSIPLKVRSLVGLMPLTAVSVLNEGQLKKLPNFARRIQWLKRHRPQQVQSLHQDNSAHKGDLHLLSFLSKQRLLRVLSYMLDENEFLSDFGIRSLSKVHADQPFSYTTDKGHTLTIGYEPGEGESNIFGGNSNWRGPIWFPINYLIIESLRKYHEYYGAGLTVECPTRSGNYLTLDEVADHISQRLCRLFTKNVHSKRPWCGSNPDLQINSDDGLHQFFEYFNGDTGEGLGASHQTGWTGLIATLLQNPSISSTL